MNSSYDYRKFRLMYVDDEVQTTANFKAYFSDVFEIETANSGEEAWRIFSENKDRFAIVVTDQRMPNSSGVELLEKIRTARPRILRILATAYSDLDAAIAAVNSGAIYKYVTKPWDPPSLEVLLKRGMEFFLVQRELDFLMKEKMSALQRLMMTDRLLSLGVFAAGLNHHLRNSLMAIKTFLDLAPFQLQQESVDIEHLRAPNYWREFYATVQAQMRKIVGLLQEIDEIPRPTAIPISDVVSVDEEIEGVAGRFGERLAAKGIELSIHTGGTPAIQANRTMLAKTLDLLFLDELANVPVAGKIGVETRAVTDSRGREGVQLEISDNGPGVTVSNLNCIFDPFFVRSADPQEYGLNLLASFFIVYHHGGTMSVSRSEQGGASFQIFLPKQQGVNYAEREETFLERVFDMEKTWEKLLIQE